MFLKFQSLWQDENMQACRLLRTKNKRFLARFEKKLFFFCLRKPIFVKIYRSTIITKTLNFFKQFQVFSPSKGSERPIDIIKGQVLFSPKIL